MRAGRLSDRAENPSSRTGLRNVAVPDCEAFAEVAPSRQLTLRAKLSGAGVLIQADRGYPDLLFDRLAFARDPRIASFGWDR